MAKIKICGLTRREDLVLAAEMGADFAGFVFVPDSARYIRPEDAARELNPEGMPESLERVGVFVNEQPARIREVFRLCRLNIVQLHGEESPDYCRSLGLPYWKALRPETASGLDPAAAYPGAVLLLDGRAPGVRGGAGVRVSQDILSAASKLGRRIIIAGGISEENLAEILAYRPYGLDLSSSLEDRPGIKNPARMRRFFGLLKGNNHEPS